MQEINNSDLTKIEGGAISVWSLIGIGALVVFAIGILDGIVNPKKCNK